MPETVLGKNVLTVTLARRVEPQLSKVSSMYLNSKIASNLFNHHDITSLEDFHPICLMLIYSGVMDEEQVLDPIEAPSLLQILPLDSLPMQIKLL